MASTAQALVRGLPSGGVDGQIVTLSSGVPAWVNNPYGAPSWGVITGTLANQTDLDNRFKAIEGKYVRATRFASVSAGTGTVAIPANNTVILDDFGGTVDAVVSEVSGGKPTYVSAKTAAGAIISTTFDASGNYVLSGTPTSYPVAIVYRTRCTLVNFDNSAADIIDSTVNTGVNFVQFATVAAAEAATVSSDTIAYIAEKEALYNYCTGCMVPRDGDLILNTGAGGNTRWEMIQKNSRNFGDTGIIAIDGAVLSTPDTTTLRLTVATGFTYAVKGKRKTLAPGDYDIVMTGPSAQKYIYFDDDSGVMKQGTTFFDFKTQAPLAIVFWGGTTIGGVQTEFHGMRDAVWHASEHKYVGTRYDSGFTFTANVQPDTTNNPADSTCEYLWSTSGTIADEDALVTVDSTGQWAQVLGSGLTSTTAAVLWAFYWNGTRIAGVSPMADRTPFIHAGGNTLPQWNNGGTLEAAVDGDYVVYHYFAAPFINGLALFMRPHNAKYTTLAAALTATPSNLIWTSFSEYKHLYTAVFRCRTGFTNTTHRCKMVSLQSYRLTPGSPSSGFSATDHQALSNRSAANAHPATSVFTDTTNFGALLSASDLTVQQALDTLDNHTHGYCK